MSLAYRGIRKVGYLLRLRLEAEPGPPWRAAMWVLACLIRLHGWTLRCAFEDRAGYFAGRVEQPAIFVLWHNRIFHMPALSARYRKGMRKAFVLTSASPEGSLLALVMAHFGIGAVRGSTSRRGSVALRELAARVTQGHDIMITPDGPRGPRYRLQPGALFLAQQTGAPILLLHIEYSRYRRFKTWDGFVVSRPFAKVRIVIDEPFWMRKGMSDEEFEETRQRLERRMTDSMLMDGAASPA